MREVFCSFILTVVMLASIMFGITRPAAKEVRLIGWCVDENGQGKLLAAMEEDNFPKTGCKWIEEIKYNVS
jgi:hypothetical protein